MKNLFLYLLENAERDHVAFIEENTSTTYGELLLMAEEVARTLKQSEIKFQERIGILADNSAFWAASYLGIIKAGAVAVPLPSRLTSDDLEKYTRIVQCRAFCIDDHAAAKYPRICSASNSIIVLKSTIMAHKEQIVDMYTKSETVTVNPEKDLAALMFTSGSTGEPNAVKVTHKNIMANTNAINDYLQLSPEDRMMTILPFHYCFGTSLLHTHLRAGGSLVINNYFQYTEDTLNSMEASGCTGFAGVPSTFQSLLNNQSFRKRHFPALRYIQQAGGKLSEKYITELRNVLPPQVQLFIGYGQTEATARLSCLLPEKLAEKTGSIGRGISGVKLQVVGKFGTPVKQGEVGEIVAEGDNITAGYLFPDPAKNPFRNGKLYTGDLAYVDEEGYIYIVGREKDFIKPSGYKVMTATIENVILEMTEITEVAVVGIPDDQLGEAAKAYVVVNKGMERSLEQIIEHCKSRLPAYALPRKIEFMTALPKNTAGKIQKNLLTTK
ncbi:MAG: acyl--CoA ligase [Chlorobiaceae bacterium]|nr:acyl--CoA ligase [Chlorobiaceae bacterium]NTV16628.1 acyl--CoA ligase [Chlorobiaceae bacterium]